MNEFTEGDVIEIWLNLACLKLVHLENGKTVAEGRAEVAKAIEVTEFACSLPQLVTGEVLEANTALADSPELVNESCYDSGWILAISPTDESEFENLMDARAYRAYVEEREGSDDDEGGD